VFTFALFAATFFQLSVGNPAHAATLAELKSRTSELELTAWPDRRRFHSCSVSTNLVDLHRSDFRSCRPTVDNSCRRPEHSCSWKDPKGEETWSLAAGTKAGWSEEDGICHEISFSEGYHPLLAVRTHSCDSLQLWCCDRRGPACRIQEYFASRLMIYIYRPMNQLTFALEAYTLFTSLCTRYLAGDTNSIWLTGL
jgi:hypothetical protein